MPLMLFQAVIAVAELATDIDPIDLDDVVLTAELSFAINVLSKPWLFTGK